VPLPSPYCGLPTTKWVQKTRQLIAAHPLDTKEIVDVVLLSWDAIFQSKIGPRGFRIGEHLSPKPQIMGFFLHELIPLELSARYPKFWRADENSSEKDLVYMPSPEYSIEIKTSSHKCRIFGNRSFAQPSLKSKKSKAGYYLAMNFEAFAKSRVRPRIRRIRFGWLDHDDWVGQTAATGQQACLRPESESNKLVVLYEAPSEAQEC
jgi:hypothetical protein